MEFRWLLFTLLALTAEGLLWPDALVPFSIDEDRFEQQPTESGNTGP